MDGIHDFGGRQGFGRAHVEPDEPVFHQPWEGRTFGLMSALGFGNIDAGRHAIERIPPQEYLSLPYYGRWLRALETTLVESEVLASGELEARLAGEAFSRETPAPEQPPPAGPVRRSTDREPAFRVGDTVRTKNLHRSGHTRLPGYARVRRGVVSIVHPDLWVLPDTNAHGNGENPERVYAVRFTGSELWGDEAEPGTSVHIDLFESYLEPDDTGADA